MPASALCRKQTRARLPPLRARSCRRASALCFFLIIRRPPRSTLFPSPPLFRPPRAVPLVDVALQRLEHFVRRELADVLEADRKSTRLNSSHIPLSRMPSSAL